MCLCPSPNSHPGAWHQAGPPRKCVKGAEAGLATCQTVGLAGLEVTGNSGNSTFGKEAVRLSPRCVLGTGAVNEGQTHQAEHWTDGNAGLVQRGSGGTC